MKKWFTRAIFFSLVSVFFALNLFADENPAPTENTPAPAASSLPMELLSQKVDKIGATQTQILKELEEIKAELDIVKIRASQR